MWWETSVHTHSSKPSTGRRWKREKWSLRSSPKWYERKIFLIVYILLWPCLSKIPQWDIHSNSGPFIPRNPPATAATLTESSWTRSLGCPTGTRCSSTPWTKRRLAAFPSSTPNWSTWWPNEMTKMWACCWLRAPEELATVAWNRRGSQVCCSVINHTQTWFLCYRTGLKMKIQWTLFSVYCISVYREYKDQVNLKEIKLYEPIYANTNQCRECMFFMLCFFILLLIWIKSCIVLQVY